MRPLKLQVGGFTCFREDTQISFDDLSLFAIEGPTGSGKSTILDAVTYALYGQTPRLGSRGLDVLLSPGLDQMYVVFDFAVNGGQAYRVTRTLDKKSSRVEPNVRVQELAGGDWKQLPESEKIKEANRKLETLVGLDYDGFTRAVMLPQGAFDEFLRGDASKRRKLLVNLLSLDRVETMQKEAGQRAREADMRRKSIEERLEQDYGGATPERLRELKDQLAGLEQEKRRLDGERAELEGRLKSLDEVKALLDEQTRVNETLAGLEAKAESYREDHKALEDARRAALIVPQLEELARKETKLEALQKTRTGHEDRRTELQTAVERAQAKLQKAEGEAERLPDIARKLEALAGVAPLMRQLKARGGEMALLAQADEATPYSDAAWDALQARRHQLPSLKRALQDVAEAEKAFEGTEKALAQTEAQAEALGEELARVKTQGKAAREKLNAAEGALREAELADRAAALRPHLHLGEPCPVCEQTVSSLPPDKGVDVAALEHRRDEVKADLDKLLETHAQTSSRLETAKARAQDRKTELGRAKEALARHQDYLADVQKELPATDPKELEATLEATRVRLLAGLAHAIHVQAKGLDPESAPAQLDADKKRIEAGLKAAQEQHGRAVNELQSLMTKLELTLEQLQALETELASSKEAFASVMERAGFRGADEVRAAALPEPRMQALEGRIKAYERERDAAERREVELRHKLAGRTLDEAEYVEMQGRREELEGCLETAQQRLGSTRQLLEDLEVQLERARELRAELKRLAEVYDTYRQLNLDLRGNEFPDYLLARVQSELAIRASTIIRSVTDGRYDLRLTDNEYQVIDAWNTGEPRSAKTLSGGETFIASLALALALSDTVAGSTSLGALFLDEGFGTLDAETLDSVAGVLESLTAEGRMVGIITHVTALSERLPARLRVHKGPDGSSVYWDV